MATSRIEALCVGIFALVMTLRVLWVGQQFHFIRKADRWLLWVNIAFLLLVSFVPFTTALLGEYPSTPGVPEC
jgi:uncharacterized membrane protein